MPHGKRRDYRDQCGNPAKGGDQAEQKQKMVNAAQNMLDAEPDKADRRLVPRRIKRHAAGGTGDHHRPTGFAERDEPNGQLDVIPQFGAKPGLY
jgi:hypothetical protein